MTTEIGGALSNFFHGQSKLEEHQEKLEKQKKQDQKKGKKSNLVQEAIDNVIRVRQTKQFYTDLERMVRWELGMPDLWREIVDEHKRLLQERLDAEALAEKEERKRARASREFWEKWELRAAAFIGIMFFVIAMTGLFYGIHLDYQDRKKEDTFNRKFFEKQWQNRDVQDCWVAYQATGLVSDFCMKFMGKPNGNLTQPP